MDYSEFSSQTLDANNLLASGRFKEAESIILALIIKDISDLDKATLCDKMAYIYDRQGKSEEALTWYEKGAAYEQIYGRFEITEKKAEYLAQLGQSKEAIAIYESLASQPYLTEADKNRIRKSIQSLLGRQMREWR